MKLTKTMQRILNSNGETTAVQTARRMEKMGLIKITHLYVERARLGNSSMKHRRERLIVQFEIIKPETSSASRATAPTLSRWLTDERERPVV